MIDQNALKSIEDLHRLKTEGLITEEDYEKAKERLLFGGQPAKRVAASVPTAVPLAGPWDKVNPAVGEHLAWVLLPLRRYADFKGRSSRKEFWMFQLVFVALGLLAVVALNDARDYEGYVTGGNMALLGAVFLGFLGLLVPLLAVEVRRLHDQDKSGWLVLINLVPYVGALVIFILMLIEGTPGENQYGPDPTAD